ncbi:MAG: histidinol-phosphate transaminase [Spirochaetales bacterium]|nr:histidinol-phosphate transaminase [Spirochaetales bacterium]
MLSERIRKLTPYVPGEQPRDKAYIKLNTNENPYPPSPGIRELLKTFDYNILRLYPDPLALNLREKIGNLYQLPPDCVFAGNGSDEVLSFAFFAFFDNSRGELFFPEFTYSFYPVYCDFYSIRYKKIPLKPDFGIDLDAFLQADSLTSASCGIIFPNPNAPTGMYINLKDIQAFLNAYAKDRVVIIDEAYIDFGGESAASLVPEYNNLLIVKTFSKSRSLAGLRLGYALGQAPLIKALFTAKDSFNSYPLDTLAQKIGELAIEDSHYYSQINSQVAATREILSTSLSELGWKVFPSKANFVFAGKPGIPGEVVYRTLKEHGILVRYFNKQGIKDYVRITVGTEKEITLFLEKVKKLFSS